MRSLHCLEQTVTRNMDVNDSAIEDSEESGKYSRENIYHHREYKNWHEQAAGRIMDVEVIVAEGSGANEERVIENRRKGNPCYIDAESWENYVVRACGKKSGFFLLLTVKCERKERS